MIKITNCINAFKKCYENNKAKDHLEIKNCFDVSTTVYKSTDPDTPLFVAGFTGDYSYTFLLLTAICAAICAVSLIVKLITKACRFLGCLFCCK